MKKFFKVCAIIVLVLVIVGGLMFGISMALSGPESLSKAAEEVSDGWLTFDMTEGINITIGGSNVEDFLKDNAIYSIEDADMFDKNHDIWKGDVEKTLLAEGGIKEWNLELGGCAFELKDSGNNAYYMEYEGKGKSQAYVKGEKLYVKVLNGSDWNVGNKTECLTLYVPMSLVVEEIEADLGAGQMMLDDLLVKSLVLNLGAGQVNAQKLQAEKLSVSVGAGEIILKEARLNAVEVEVGAGNCEIGGTITGDVDAECAMGNLTFELTGNEKDFNYDIQCVTGNITVGDKEYSGLAQEREIDNNASKNMEVECAMGNVEILFE